MDAGHLAGELRDLPHVLLCIEGAGEDMARMEVYRFLDGPSAREAAEQWFLDRMGVDEPLSVSVLCQVYRVRNDRAAELEKDSLDLWEEEDEG